MQANLGKNCQSSSRSSNSSRKKKRSHPLQHSTRMIKQGEDTEQSICRRSKKVDVAALVAAGFPYKGRFLGASSAGTGPQEREVLFVLRLLDHLSKFSAVMLDN